MTPATYYHKNACPNLTCHTGVCDPSGVACAPPVFPAVIIGWGRLEGGRLRERLPLHRAAQPVGGVRAPLFSATTGRAVPNGP